jgi:transposase
MEQLYTTCAGLDVHKQTVVAGVLRPSAAGRTRKEVRTFAPPTNALLALADWLRRAGCTHVAMEATGSYWKPVYNILEGAAPFSL